MPIINSFASSGDWQYRHAAMVAMSTCNQAIAIDAISSAVQLVCRFTADPERRVRFAAVTALGTMCFHQGPIVQMEFHEPVRPHVRHCNFTHTLQLVASFVACMQDEESTLVKSQAAASVVHFVEYAPKPILGPYLETLLRTLFSLLESGNLQLQEDALVAITSLADAASHLFSQFYDIFMPFVRSIVHTPVSQEFRLLRGRAIECMTILGQSVPRESFIGEARELADLLLAQESSGIDSDDPQRPFIWHAWGRIAKVLGEEFKPYLKAVLPSLLECSSEDMHVERVAVNDEGDVEGDDDDDEDEDTYFDNAGEVLKVRTSQLEDRALALKMLGHFIAAIPVVMADYIEECVAAFTASLNLSGTAFDDIRGYAVRRC